MLFGRALTFAEYRFQLKFCAAVVAAYALFQWVNAPNDATSRADANKEFVQAAARASTLAKAREEQTDAKVDRDRTGPSRDSLGR
jgi:hypothetical protein